jgi:hypothetical protein
MGSSTKLLERLVRSIDSGATDHDVEFAVDLVSSLSASGREPLQPLPTVFQSAETFVAASTSRRDAFRRLSSSWASRDVSVAQL